MALVKLMWNWVVNKSEMHRLEKTDNCPERIYDLWIVFTVDEFLQTFDKKDRQANVKFTLLSSFQPLVKKSETGSFWMENTSQVSNMPNL